MRRLLLIFVLSVVTIVLPVQAQFEFGMAGPELNYKNTIETDVVHANTSFRAAAHFTLSSGWHVNSNAPMEEYLIATELRLKEVPGFTVEGVAYPRHSVYTFEFSPDQEMAVYGEVFTIGLLLHADETLTPGSYELVGVLHYQACNDSMCAPPGDLEIVWTVTVVETSAPLKQVAPDWFMQVNWADAGAVSPESLVPVSSSERVVSDGNWRELVEEFNIAGLGGFSNTAGFLEFIDKVEAGKTTDALAVSRHWWVMLLLVLGGGILLNLTPCVLPLMPINIAIIGAGAHAGSRRRGFALGSAYGLGIALVYGALGLLVVLGMSAAFGTLNSTAWFNAVIALLFVLLSLAMFDIVEIDFSKYQAKMGLRGNSGGHFLVALGMGAVSALLAGACVAPVVIYTILQAQDLYSQGNMFALGLPFCLGLGMALPWPFLGAGLSLLPKPGKWMTRVKQAFGIFILGFALYYGHLAYTLTQPAVSFEEEGGVWSHSLEEGLERALEEQRPVLIDFWATWCKNCSVMNRNTLQDEEVLSRLEDYVKIKYQAEVLGESPAKDVVEYFQILGLPAFIILEPKE